MDQISRKPLIAGNWKMFKTALETVEYIEKLKNLLQDMLNVDVTLAPPFTSLDAAVKAADGSIIKIAAQNVFWEEKGAFTGEIAAGMLKALNVAQVIIGHSERRQYFGETDETVNKRIKAALAAGLEPIVCVGETLEQREGGLTMDVIETQVKGALEGLSDQAAKRLILAYEPVWAIGSGRTATPEIAQKVHGNIREILSNIFNKGLANEIRILYGGSVKSENAASLMGQEDIDGALVGGASLKADDFIKIINFG